MKKIHFVHPDPEGWLNKFHFSTQIKVRYCETDMLGHVNNVSYFMYFEQGRIDYFENLQLTEDLFGAKYVSVVADMECHYLGQVYLKDLIDLHVRVAKIGRSSMVVEYAVVVENELRAAGRGTIVLVATETGKSSPITVEARNIIRSFEGNEIEEKVTVTQH